MLIDIYVSIANPLLGLAVPAGTNLQSLGGQVTVAVNSLSPLHKKSMNVVLEDIFKGDLQKHLLDQIAAEGAGRLTGNVSFGF